jgi:hypothetical protein
MIARENVSLPKMASTRGGGVVDEPFVDVEKDVGVSTVVTGRRASHMWMEMGWTADNNARAGAP